MKTKAAFVFLFLFALSAAVTVEADFEPGHTVSGHHFATDIMMNPDFTLSLVSGDLVSTNVDPNNLPSGTQVCPGAVIGVEPDLESKWAVSHFEGKAWYQCCGYYYNSCDNTEIQWHCPSMMSYSTVNLNRDIKWLSTSTYNSFDSLISTIDFETGQDGESSYNQLGGSSGFSTQSVTYVHDPCVPESNNKRGFAGVFCKGKLRVTRNGQAVGSDITLPGTGTREVTLSTIGSHTIGLELRNNDCFASIVKRPLETCSNFFLISYYGHNAPSISASETKTIEVVQAAQPCSINVLSSTYHASTMSDIFLVVATVQNTGSQPTELHGVNAMPPYNAFKFNTALCNVLGLQSLCPLSNGFDETIPAWQSQNVYILLDTNGNPPENAQINVYGRTVGAQICGGQGLCSDSFSPSSSSDIVSCEIDPPTLDAGRLIAYEWTVTCYDATNTAVPCVGDDWYMGGGLTGIFVDWDNTHAIAGFTSPIGSTGTMNYESGLAHCWSDITVVDPSSWLVCEFDPSSATMEVGDEQYFDLTCYWDGQEVTINDADYGLANGLVGSTSNESTEGVTFEGTQNSSGILWGIGWYQHPSLPHMVGGIAIADITVGNQSGNETNGGNGDEDEDEDCRIGDTPGPLQAWPGMVYWLPIYCGDNLDEQPCSVASWTYAPPNDGNVWGDNWGVNVVATAEPGSSGTITATLTNGGYCTKEVNIVYPECWEFS